MYLNPLILASLGLSTLGYGAPVSSNIEISITTDSPPPDSVLVNHMICKPTAECDSIVNLDLSFQHVGRDFARCCKTADDTTASTGDAPTSLPVCIAVPYPLGTDCASEIGPGWKFKKETGGMGYCCNGLDDFVANTEDTSLSDVISTHKDSSSKTWERCINDRLPSNFDCAGRVGPDWYYNTPQRTCCKQMPDEASSAVAPSTQVNDMPTGFESKASRHSGIRVHDKMPTGFESKASAHLNSKAENVNMPNGFESDASAYSNMEVQDLMPTGFESKASSHSNMEVQDLMPTGFETKASSHSNMEVQDLMPTGFESKASAHAKFKVQNGGMPTGFESKASVDSNVEVQNGGMPTGFESKTGAEPHVKVIHAEML